MLHAGPVQAPRQHLQEAGIRVEDRHPQRSPVGGAGAPLPVRGIAGHRHVVSQHTFPARR
jgi:hypothetical protein